MRGDWTYGHSLETVSWGALLSRNLTQRFEPHVPVSARPPAWTGVTVQAAAMPMQVNQAAEPLYIVKPFKGKGIAGLFSTHPPIEERVKRLRQMRPSF